MPRFLPFLPLNQKTIKQRTPLLTTFHHYSKDDGGSLDDGRYDSTSASSNELHHQLEYQEKESLTAQQHLGNRRRSSCSTLSSASTMFSFKDTSEQKFSSTSCSYSSNTKESPINDKEDSVYASASEKKFVPPFLLIGPVLAILCCTAGMATVMILWIISHKLPLQSPGVLYLHEGDESEVGREYTDKTIGDGAKLKFNELSSHPTTLSLSSIIVYLIGNSLYFMMSHIAYGLAADWIQLQERVASTSCIDTVDHLPTPLQYALLTRLCSSNSISTILDTIRYWYKSRKSNRAGLPFLLKRALLWLLILLSLQTSIAWLDFLLHETTRTVSVINFDRMSSNLPYSMGMNQDLCPPSDTSQRRYPCLVTPPQKINGSYSTALFANDNLLIGSEGWLVANKASRQYSVKIYRDANNNEIDNMAYYTNPNIRLQDYVKVGHSIGLQAKCEMITTKCNSTSSSFDCSSLGRSELKSEEVTSRHGSEDSGDFVTISDALYSTDKDGVVQSGQEYAKGPQTNPWTISGLIVNPSSTTIPHSGFQDFPVELSDSQSRSSLLKSYGAFVCNLTVRDLQFSFFNGSYEIQSWKESEVGVAHDLSGPLLAGLVTNVAFSAIATVAGRTDEDFFSRSLEESLAFNILSLSSGLISQLLTPTRAWRPILAQQYKTGILFGYISLLYVYAITAITLFFWAWGTSSSCIVYRDQQGRRKEVPAVVLSQRRIMEPATYLIAMHLDNDFIPNKHSQSREEKSMPTASSSCSSRSAQIDLLNIFDERHDQERVVVGLESEGFGFGVWKMSRVCNAISSTSGQVDTILRAQHFHNAS